MSINCIIVDDDEFAIAHLRVFINQIPFLNLLTSYQSPSAALTAMETHDIQLIFMDIDMPEMSGMEFARMLQATHGTAAPRIIFISGYERYALEGYKVNALDYLLKPVTYEDFLKSAYKAKTHFDEKEKQAPHAEHYVINEFIFLKVEYEMVRIYLKDILYVEGLKDYVKIFLVGNSGYIKALTTMKGLEEKLPTNGFIRVHRSFIVAVDKIDSITKNTIKIGKIMIPVTEQFKDEFRKFAHQWL
ncbi:two component transcriptional regulator, LytTR family [Mucilaginibacter pineti]|uniref:Two component transcriptional regulator, LytTR family n=1 Tax=Mucilaginibacter pineti TaxID=1391627 RepID=A0A1G7C6M9_9SPHI|nr:LytTR family DNA-binding domain-containing protein [Mucilaginibacter pineti]SDE34105.1 two component transcriptional regulator, LytTR family [Mucilaginibacter pineti]